GVDRALEDVFHVTTVGKVDTLAVDVQRPVGVVVDVVGFRLQGETDSDERQNSDDYARKEDHHPHCHLPCLPQGAGSRAVTRLGAPSPGSCASGIIRSWVEGCRGMPPTGLPAG